MMMRTTKCWEKEKNLILVRIIIMIITTTTTTTTIATIPSTSRHTPSNLHPGTEHRIPRLGGSGTIRGDSNAL